MCGPKKLSYDEQYKVRGWYYTIHLDKNERFIIRNKKSEVIIFDIPLLIENKLNKKKDIIIFVKSNKSKVLNRLKKRPNFNKKLLKNLKENQVILSKKEKLADYVINNNFPVNVMKKKVKLIKKKILNERNSSRY